MSLGGSRKSFDSASGDDVEVGSMDAEALAAAERTLLGMAKAKDAEVARKKAQERVRARRKKELPQDGARTSLRSRIEGAAAVARGEAPSPVSSPTAATSSGGSKAEDAKAAVAMATASSAAAAAASPQNSEDVADAPAAPPPEKKQLSAVEKALEAARKRMAGLSGGGTAAISGSAKRREEAEIQKAEEAEAGAGKPILQKVECFGSGGAGNKTVVVEHALGPGEKIFSDRGYAVKSLGAPLQEILDGHQSVFIQTACNDKAIDSLAYLDLCFDRSARVLVCYAVDDELRGAPAWLLTHFEKTDMKVTLDALGGWMASWTAFRVWRSVRTFGPGESTMLGGASKQATLSPRAGAAAVVMGAEGGVSPRGGVTKAQNMYFVLVHYEKARPQQPAVQPPKESVAEVAATPVLRSPSSSPASSSPSTSSPLSMSLSSLSSLSLSSPSLASSSPSTDRALGGQQQHQNYTQARTIGLGANITGHTSAAAPMAKRPSLSGTSDQYLGRNSGSSTSQSSGQGGKGGGSYGSYGTQSGPGTRNSGNYGGSGIRPTAMEVAQSTTLDPMGSAGTPLAEDRRRLYCALTMEERRLFKPMTAAERRQYWSLSASEADAFLHLSAEERVEYMNVPLEVRQAKWRAREQDAVLGLTADEKQVHETLTKEQRPLFLALGMESKARETFVRMLTGEGYVKEGRARAGPGLAAGAEAAEAAEAVAAAEAGAKHAQYFWRLVSAEQRACYLEMTFEQREVHTQLTKAQAEVCWYMSPEQRTAFCRLDDDQRKKCISLAEEERTWFILMNAVKMDSRQPSGGKTKAAGGAGALFAKRGQQKGRNSVGGRMGDEQWAQAKSVLVSENLVWETTMRPLQAKGFSATESCTPLLLPFREAESVEELMQALGQLVMVLEQWAQQPETFRQKQRLPEHNELMPIAFRHKNVMRWDSNVEDLFTQAQQALGTAVGSMAESEVEQARAKAACASKAGGVGMPASLRAHTLRPNMSAADVAAAEAAPGPSSSAASRASVAEAAGAKKQQPSECKSYHPELVIWTEVHFKDGIQVEILGLKYLYMLINASARARATYTRTNPRSATCTDPQPALFCRL
jgi:hypothetical protein